MDETQETTATNRRVLLRDIGVLQVKLIVDGFRDLILVPASLIAGITSLVKSDDGKPGPQFYRLLSAGKQSERWINLFGAVKHSPEVMAEAEPFGDGDIDDLVGKIESFVVDEYQRGGVTAQAKAHLDKIISAVQRKNRGA